MMTCLVFVLLIISQVSASYNKTIKRCHDPTGCLYPGFTGPIVTWNYGFDGSGQPDYIAIVNVSAPWQVIVTDGTCWNAQFNIFIEDMAGVDSQYFPVASGNFGPSMEPTQAAAQFNPFCANTIRYYTQLGPPAAVPPPFNPNQPTYANTFRIRINVQFSSINGYAFLQIVPFYVSMGNFNAGGNTFFFVFPWQVYVPSDGIDIPTLCAIRGASAYVSNGSISPQVTLSQLIYGSQSLGTYFPQTRFLMDDGTGNTCYTTNFTPIGSAPTFVANPLECAQVASGSLPVLCFTLTNQYYTFPS